MKHEHYETRCKECEKSLDYLEDKLCLKTCLFCRQNKHGSVSIPSSSQLFPLGIKSLIDKSLLMATRNVRR